MAGLFVVMLLRVTGLSPKLPGKGQAAVADVEAAAPGSNHGGGPEAGGDQAAGGSMDGQRQTADAERGNASNGASAAAPVLWSSDSAAWFFSLHQVGRSKRGARLRKLYGEDGASVKGLEDNVEATAKI